MSGAGPSNRTGSKRRVIGGSGVGAPAAASAAALEQTITATRQKKHLAHLWSPAALEAAMRVTITRPFFLHINSHLSISELKGLGWKEIHEMTEEVIKASEEALNTISGASVATAAKMGKKPFNRTTSASQQLLYADAMQRVRFYRGKQEDILVQGEAPWAWGKQMSNDHGFWRDDLIGVKANNQVQRFIQAAWVKQDWIGGPTVRKKMVMVYDFSAEMDWPKVPTFNTWMPFAAPIFKAQSRIRGVLGDELASPDPSLAAIAAWYGKKCLGLHGSNPFMDEPNTIAGLDGSHTHEGWPGYGRNFNPAFVTMEPLIYNESRKFCRLRMCKHLASKPFTVAEIAAGFADFSKKIEPGRDLGELLTECINLAVRSEPSAEEATAIKEGCQAVHGWALCGFWMWQWGDIPPLLTVTFGDDGPITMPCSDVPLKNENPALVSERRVSQLRQLSVEDILSSLTAHREELEDIPVDELEQEQIDELGALDRHIQQATMLAEWAKQALQQGP